MDERYFLYFEDAEFSLRARKAGFPTQLCMESRVYHAEGATTGKNSLRTRYYYHRNRLLLLSEYGSHLQHGTVAAYSFYRLLRTALKALTKQTYRPELRVEWLALCDVLRGKFGPCRHSL
jgi:GT2 family glycosyltransferase